MGTVSDTASATPSRARTAVEWPMLTPGPKLVYVTPRGAMASSSARTTESVPGSQPAATTATQPRALAAPRSEEHTSELQSRENLVCRLLLEKKNNHAPIRRHSGS